MAQEAVTFGIIGDEGVGKRTLIILYFTGSLPPYIPSFLETQTTNVMVDQSWVQLKFAPIDSPNEFRPEMVDISYYNSHADIFLIAFSVVKPISFENVSAKWYPQMKHFLPHAACLLVGTQTDLRDNRETREIANIHATPVITYSQGVTKAKDIGALKYMECSSVDGYGLDKLIPEAIRGVRALRLSLKTKKSGPASVLTHWSSKSKSSSSSSSGKKAAKGGLSIGLPHIGKPKVGVDVKVDVPKPEAPKAKVDVKTPSKGKKTRSSSSSSKKTPTGKGSGPSPISTSGGGGGFFSRFGMKSSGKVETKAPSGSVKGELTVKPTKKSSSSSSKEKGKSSERHHFPGLGFGKTKSKTTLPELPAKVDVKVAASKPEGKVVVEPKATVEVNVPHRSKSKSKSSSSSSSSGKTGHSKPKIDVNIKASGSHTTVSTKVKAGSHSSSSSKKKLDVKLGASVHVAGKASSPKIHSGKKSKSSSSSSSSGKAHHKAKVAPRLINGFPEIVVSPACSSDSSDSKKRLAAAIKPVDMTIDIKARLSQINLDRPALKLSFKPGGKFRSSSSSWKKPKVVAVVKVKGKAEVSSGKKSSSSSSKKHSKSEAKPKRAGFLGSLFLGGVEADAKVTADTKTDSKTNVSASAEVGSVSLGVGLGGSAKVDVAATAGSKAAAAVSTETKPAELSASVEVSSKGSPHGHNHEKCRKELQEAKEKLKLLEDRNSALEIEMHAKDAEIERILGVNKHLSECLREVNEQVLARNVQLEEKQKEIKKLIVVQTELTASKEIAETMTSLVGAGIESFGLEKFLGSGSNAATFQVQSFQRRNVVQPHLSARMAMKVLFNWENTPQQTLIKQKYMKECLILASLPLHPNVIHPLGTLVIPRFPQEFINAIPSDQPVYKELALNKSLAFLLPFCGVSLGNFFATLEPGGSTTTRNSAMPSDIITNLLAQALSAVCHLERAHIVHRDIKEDNVLVDPATHKLTLIDFGEAEECTGDDLEATIVRTAGQVWGNTGTMPPEVSVLSQDLVRMSRASCVFSYSKCDSFSLALTFYNALLPPTKKFIGQFKQHMSTFNPSMLPPLAAQWNNSNAAVASPGPTPAKAYLSASVSSAATQTERKTTSMLLLGMMSPDRTTRLSASYVLETLNTSL
ncbi:hypothetical protein Pelo_2233 [Pelomyxa schiedti]|nr:hypothetical protein Pelo_2233 [Pelomyxa schiedti]